MEQPVDGDLGDRFVGFLGDDVEGIDDFEEEFFIVGRRGGVGFFAVESACRGERLAAADFAGEAAPAEWAPDDGADALVESERHEFPFVVAPEEGVVGLVGDVPREAVLVGVGERFHEVPAGEVGAADVADFAGADEVIQDVHSFFDGRFGVEAVELIEVDVVGLQTFELSFDGFDEMEAAAADVVGALAEAEGGFGGDEDFVAAAFDGGAENFFGEAGGIDVGGVEHCQAGVEAKVDEFCGAFGVCVAPGFEELIAATEGACAECEFGDEETGAA